MKTKQLRRNFISKQLVMTFAAFVAVTAIYLQTTMAQYPSVPSDVAEQARQKMAAMNKRSDQAWEKAMPAIKDWEAKGKPYIPWAAKPDDLPQAPIPAFPGAQGGGMYSFGGRGGKVFVVTNLNDRGPGSFREALEAGGPRIVVFNVAGIIKLDERIRIRAPYITIAGSTAPGDGICIAGDTVELETHDVIIRHMRFRRGATWVGDRNDSIGGNPIGNIIIDHVSASWGLDENMSMYRHMYTPPDGSRALKLPTVNITIQNSIFSEALDTYNHSFGSTIGGYNSTFHHNLWACNMGRNPSVGMIYDFTFVNNVIYNWRHRTTDGGGPGSFYSMINNYYKPGPVTPADHPIRYRIIKPDGRFTQQGEPRFGKVYASGNLVEGNPAVTMDNWAGGVQVDEEDGHDPNIVLPLVRQDAPYPHAYIDIESAQDAYQTVLANAGATLPRRDAVDERVIEQVRTGRITTSPQVDPNSLYQFEHRRLGRDSYLKGIITDIRLVGGYPEYRGTPYKDADMDGMPDEWELKCGLDPKDPSDASGDLNGDGYTNIEDFINGLDPKAAKVEWKTPKTFVDIWKNAG